MSKRIAVIGSNSFSGSHFVNTCLSQGDEVLGMSRSDEPNSVFLPYHHNDLSKFNFLKLDLNRDLIEITKQLETFKPQFVVNFAAQGMVAESWNHPEHWYQTNVVSTIKLQMQLKEFSFLERYVQISTPEVYGSVEGNIIENVNYNPSTPYAVSKAAADMNLSAMINVYGFPGLLTRAVNVYGAHQQLYRIIPRTILYFLTGRKLQLQGGGESIRSFIHINDVVEATYLLMTEGKTGEIYHIATDEGISIRSLVEKIAEKIGVEFEDCVEITEDRVGKDRNYSLNSDKVRKLGWRDQISLDEGLDETIEWVKGHLDTLTSQSLNYVHKP